RIITRLRAEGYALTHRHEGADCVIVNTCGFIDSAKAESLEAIGTALAENGKVIVTGCMGAQPQSISERFPNVLSITGPQAYESVVQAVHRAAPPAHDPKIDLVPLQGIKLTPRHYAYLKISEGCNNRCSFCIIPQLRGRLVSRPLPEVMREAERLVAAGVKELLVISQDTSAYGLDRRHEATSWKGTNVETRILDLARGLGSLGAWVRLHYVYPYPHVDALVPLMAEGLILPYLDIPFQHASPKVLKAMRRPAAQEKILARLSRWRGLCPEIAIRSTFIVGFPGETQDDFEELLHWLSEAKLDRVGCFIYEPVKGAVANDLGLAPVPEDEAKSRHDRFMRHQQAISFSKLRAKIGKRVTAIVDQVTPKGAIGRTMQDAPEIDGNIILSSRMPLAVGDIVSAKVKRAQAYDLHGTVV
ncbi:MAG: 30S ribosomal protein S12 methylthiotransferase RimO, partial [Hyphomicrobiales bacterium]|nr:30S ribosomal protein S12 methylthiotransferase RimO [Hyphomicrobiales bacterium]